MDIYLVIKIAGLISAVAGPLPYNGNECLESLSTLKTTRTITAECIATDTRPLIEIEWPNDEPAN